MSTLFYLMDAAVAGSSLAEAQRLNPRHLGLYKGRSAKALAAVAPYLFACESGTPFGRWIRTRGWGRSWGIYCESEMDLPGLVHHFRKFLLVKDEKGKQLYFRYYDPRVIRTVLPVCDRDQLKEFFGPVRGFVAEDADPDFALRFTLQQGQLRQERAAASGAGWLAPPAA